MLNLDPKLSVGRLVLEHPEAAPILERHHIDYCCGGETRLSDAAFLRGVELEELVAELEDAAAGPTQGPAGDARALTTPELLRHLAALGEEERLSLPGLEALAARVSFKHAEQNPLLAGIAARLSELAELLEEHLRLEEARLFEPLARGAPLPNPDDAEAQLEPQHRALGALLGELRALSEDYTPPRWACVSHDELFRKLERLEGELMHRVHLEQQLLMPRLRRGGAAR